MDAQRFFPVVVVPHGDTSPTLSWFAVVPDRPKRELNKRESSTQAWKVKGVPAECRAHNRIVMDISASHMR